MSQQVASRNHILTTITTTSERQKKTRWQHWLLAISAICVGVFLILMVDISAKVKDHTRVQELSDKVETILIETAAEGNKRNVVIITITKVFSSQIWVIMCYWIFLIFGTVTGLVLKDSFLLTIHLVFTVILSPPLVLSISQQHIYIWESVMVFLCILLFCVEYYFCITKMLKNMDQTATGNESEQQSSKNKQKNDLLNVI